METERRTRQPFFGWWIVAVSTIGVAFCATPVVFLTLGVFMIPLGEEFGWNRAEISLGLSVAALSLAIATPWAGRMLDARGPRRVLKWSLALYAVATATLYFLESSILQFYAVLGLIGVLGAGSNTIAYSRVISSWFDRQRGLALGITMSGIGLGATMMPAIAQGLIDAFGWRGAYAGLGLIVLLIAYPLVISVIRDNPRETGLSPDGDEPETQKSGLANESAATMIEGGLRRAEAFRSRDFWLLNVIFLVMAAAVHGVQIHLVPLLRDHGFSAQMAAIVASTMGFATLVARIAEGYLFDRFFAPKVAIVVFLGATAGIALLQTADLVWLAWLGAILIGVGAGAESSLLGYLTSRYFGLRSFGELFGYVFASFMIGTAIGPYAIGLCYVAFGSYEVVLWVCVFILLFMCILMGRLGPFPGRASA
jgi:MFS family permease